LRWTAFRIDNLLEALEARFEGVGTPGQTVLDLNYGINSPREYQLIDRRFGMSMHTHTTVDQISYEKMLAQCCGRQSFLKRKLIEDLEAGEKIFVYKMAERNLTRAELDRLFRAIRRYGDGTLLYVRLADANHPSGSAEVLYPGLIVGYVSQFNLGPNGRQRPLDIAAWRSVCSKAYELYRATLGGRPSARLSGAATS
jgi:hypothetical protein